MTNSFKFNFILNTIFYSLIAIMLFLAAKFLLAYLFPVLIGIAITVVVQKPAKIISAKTSIKKGYCALFLVLVIYLSIILTVGFGLYKIGAYIADIIGKDSDYFNKFTVISAKLVESIDKFIYMLPKSFRDFFANTINGIFNSISGYVTNFAQSTAKSVPMFLTGSIVTIIASCYIARDFDRFKYSLKSVIGNKILLAYRMTAELFKTNVLRLALGYVKLLLITFIELYIGFVLLRVEYAFLLALIISLLDLLPIIGTGTVLIPWSIMEMLSNNLYLGSLLLFLYAAITIIRNIVEPKIIGRQMGLHPLIALIIVFIGLKLLGFIGIFVLPFTVMFIYKMYDSGIFEILLSSKNSGE